MTVPEVLAPAGSAEALTAAVRCGADAVYLGAGMFNARRGAENFSPEALANAVSYCHGRGVKIYLALNTLIRGDELEHAMRLSAFACEAGMDALILQDTGLARRIRAAAPDMPLHASTQLSCHSSAGARLLADAGFSRVVLAREMTKTEIAECRGMGAELEVFVHGALCMSVSGQCLLSAVLGGRSGNRGLCAQPCRLPFSAGLNPPGQGDAALSLRDLSLLDHVGELAGMGIASLKIEGRMKRPEYVAAAVKCYTAAVRGEPLAEGDAEALRAVFSRSGFTDGYFTGKRNSMFGVRGADDVRAAEPVLGRIRRGYAAQTPRVPVDMELRVQPDEPASLTVHDRKGGFVKVYGAFPQEAVSAGLDEARAVAQLEKTGGTPFFAGGIQADIAPGLSLPVSAVNALRRDALEQLLELRGRFVPVEWTPGAVPDPPCGVPVRELYRKDRPRVAARFSSFDQMPDQCEWDMAVLPLSTPPERLGRAARKSLVAVEVPRTLFGKEADIRRLLESAAKAGAGAAVCGNVGAIIPARESGLPVIAGPGLHVFNRDTMDFLAEQGAGAALVSPELKFSQMEGLLSGPLPAGIFAYGRLPLMLMRACPLKERSGGCGECARGTEKALTDRLGTRFPVACGYDGSASELLNSVPVYLADRLNDLPDADFLYLYFTDESPADVSRILWEYRHGGIPPKAFTRGMVKQGVG